MPEYFALTEPFKATVYKMGKKGNPIVRAPNGDDVVINDYGGLEKPQIGHNVRIIVTQDGKGMAYSFGKLLEVYPSTQSRIQSLIERLNPFKQKKQKINWSFFSLSGKIVLNLTI